MAKIALDARRGLSSSLAGARSVLLIPGRMEAPPRALHALQTTPLATYAPRVPTPSTTPHATYAPRVPTTTTTDPPHARCVLRGPTTPTLEPTLCLIASCAL